MKDCALLVMSCDRYETAWYPYFSLLHRFWAEHPTQIVLSTESKEYYHDGLAIQCVHAPEGFAWSDRLLCALQSVSTKYVVLSLEDFFLQGPVQNEVVEKCHAYMEQHPDVAQCRFKNCDNAEQIDKLGDMVFQDFYLAGTEVIYRLDTQIALWNRETLISFVVSGENPWQFETKGTQRIKNTSKQFLWYKSPYPAGETQMLIFPYQMSLESGFGISMGHWLWNNKKLFQDNNLPVRMDELGIYSQFQVRYRLFKNKALYQDNSNLIYWTYKLCYRIINKFIRLLK